MARLPEQAPTLEELFAHADLNTALPLVLRAGVGPTVSGEYRHWDDIRRSTPPDGLTREQWWLGIKWARAPLRRTIPLRATDGTQFHYSLPDPVLELLSWIDQHAAGEILVSETVSDPGQRQRYLVNSLMEESITSSQLEGASATRKAAKDMIRSGRQPRDKGERMILNNFRAMSSLRDSVDQPLTPDILFDLHRVLTEGTLDDTAAAGRAQRPDEERVHVEDSSGTVVHRPPAADQLEARIRLMCDFANEEQPGGFMHPVVKAVLLHLWLAYDHPFEDGNGRTARALFYREMLRRGYWLFEYISISRLLLKAPAKYGRSFLHTETDEFDATYFLIYQLRIVKRAIQELHVYLQAKMAEMRETLTLLRRTSLNHRQVALLTHALRHHDAEYTYRSHARSHNVVIQSARTDILDLEDRGFLIRRVVGNRYFFYPAADLAASLRNAS